VSKGPRLPTLLVLAIAIAIIVWAYDAREVHATVSFDQDEVVIKSGAPADA
jgi:hypothetical protein